MTATQSTPVNVLIDVISTLLVPMFLAASNGDVALAQTAAIQTMNAYRVGNQAHLVTVAQILSFSLAALGSLALSFDDDLSLSMILRLRGNANACTRSAEQHRRALHASHQETLHPALDAAEPRETQPAAPSCAAQAQPPSPPAATPAPAQPPKSPVMPMTPDQQRRAMWAAAFNEVAAECTAEIPHLPPVEQKAASIRAAALSSSATALLSGVDMAPYRPEPITPPKSAKPR